MKKRLLIVILASILAVATLMFGCSKSTPASSSPATSSSAATTKPSSPAPTASSPTAGQTISASELATWEKNTYEAARKEGQVVWYTQDAKTHTDPMVEAFGKKYPGVKLVVYATQSGGLGPKIAAEQESGQMIGDVVTTGLSDLRTFSTQGRLAYFSPPAAQVAGVKWVADPLHDQALFKEFSPVYSVSPQGAIINTKLVTPDKEPKSWMDLATPWWKGKITTQDPTVPGGANKMFYWIKRVYGEEAWSKIGAQGLILERDRNLQARAVATGEYYIGLALAPRELASIPNTPTKYITFKEGTVVSEIGIGLLKGSPHPNASKLFINYMFEEGQDITGSTGRGSPMRAGARVDMPDLDLTGQKLLLTTPEEDLKGVAEARNDIKKYLAK
ncbi:MAG: extracellular solute-binding protein [Chloroflexi bacterium]|nr:extracellular solute-binding protein [Chloroflexota bacterium]